MYKGEDGRSHDFTIVDNLREISRRSMYRRTQISDFGSFPCVKIIDGFDVSHDG